MRLEISDERPAIGKKRERHKMQTLAVTTHLKKTR